MYHSNYGTVRIFTKKNFFNLTICTIIVFFSGCALLKEWGTKLDCYEETVTAKDYNECVEARLIHPDPISVECKKIKNTDEAQGICNQLE
jgi:hypothetical protein